VDAFVWPVRVYYEDTDSGGLVYHANYLKFMERARTEWLRSLGFDQSRLQAELGVVFAVRSVGIDYLRPARYDDALEVLTRVTACRGASLTFAQSVRRINSQPELLIEASVKVACLNAGTLRPFPIPDDIRTEIKDVG
jgi:acyl-CoA thioester hydrolase